MELMEIFLMDFMKGQLSYMMGMLDFNRQLLFDLLCLHPTRFSIHVLRPFSSVRMIDRSIDRPPPSCTKHRSAVSMIHPHHRTHYKLLWSDSGTTIYLEKAIHKGGVRSQGFWGRRRSSLTDEGRTDKSCRRILCGPVNKLSSLKCQ